MPEGCSWQSSQAWRGPAGVQRPPEGGSSPGPDVLVGGLPAAQGWGEGRELCPSTQHRSARERSGVQTYLEEEARRGREARGFRGQSSRRPTLTPWS